VPGQDATVKALEGLRITNPDSAALAVLTRIWPHVPGPEHREIFELPVDPLQIAWALMVEVYGAVLPEDIWGKVVRRVGQGAQIYLNADEPTNRSRFTCAHELGHLVDPDANDVELVDNRDTTSRMGSDPREIYANRFAAALLMPEPNVREMHAEGTPVVTMARAFAVSAEAMGHRLARLRLT
jgi:hypothetical protein